MPQENQVLRCFSCKMFQVHIVKKAKKWECKVCKSKQSITKIYGRGTGKDCTLHVMKLNELQLSKEENPDLIKNVSFEAVSINHNSEISVDENREVKSKWSAYIEQEVDDEGLEDEKQSSELLPDSSRRNYCKRKQQMEGNWRRKYKKMVDPLEELTEGHSVLEDYNTHPDVDVISESPKMKTFVKQSRQQQSDSFNINGPIPKDEEESEPSKFQDFRKQQCSQTLSANRTHTFYEKTLSSGIIEEAKENRCFTSQSKYSKYMNVEESSACELKPGRNEKEITKLNIFDTTNNDDLDQILNF